MEEIEFEDPVRVMPSLGMDLEDLHILRSKDRRYGLYALPFAGELTDTDKACAHKIGTKAKVHIDGTVASISTDAGVLNNIDSAYLLRVAMLDGFYGWEFSGNEKKLVSVRQLKDAMLGRVPENWNKIVDAAACGMGVAYLEAVPEAVRLPFAAYDMMMLESFEKNRGVRMTRETPKMPELEKDIKREGKKYRLGSVRLVESRIELTRPEEVEDGILVIKGRRIGSVPLAQLNGGEGHLLMDSGYQTMALAPKYCSDDPQIKQLTSELKEAGRFIIPDLPFGGMRLAGSGASILNLMSIQRRIEDRTKELVTSSGFMEYLKTQPVRNGTGFMSRLGIKKGPLTVHCIEAERKGDRYHFQLDQLASESLTFGEAIDGKIYRPVGVYAEVEGLGFVRAEEGSLFQSLLMDENKINLKVVPKGEAAQKSETGPMYQ